MVEVVAKIEYRYSPEEALPCEAVLQVIIPYDSMVSNCSIEKMLQSAKHQILGDTLYPFWGIPVTGSSGRGKYWVLGGNTWQELEQTVYETLFDIETVLREVYEKNRKMKEARPRDREIKLVIGDGE